MAAFDFPSSPTMGQTYTANGITFTWDTVSWRASSASNGYGPVLLSERVLTSTSASETFNLPSSGYRDIEIVLRGRGTNASTFINIMAQFNSDSGSNYDYGENHNFSTSVAGTQGVAVTSAYLGYFPGSTAPADASSIVTTRISDHKGTTFHKSVIGQSGTIISTSLVGSQISFSRWRSTAAITSVTVFPDAGSFATGTVISIYGIPNTIGSIISSSSIEAYTTKPSVTDFTALNSASWSNTSNGVVTSPSSSGVTWRPLVKTAPASPYSLYVRMQLLGIDTANNQTGLFFRNSTNGRIVHWGVYSPSAGNQQLLGQRWTAYNTFSAGASFSGGSLIEIPRWFRADVTSTTITVYHSPDGYNWTSNGSETIATFLTATGGGTLDQIGFGVLEAATTGLVVHSFSFTAPV